MLKILFFKAQLQAVLLELLEVILVTTMLLVTSDIVRSYKMNNVTFIEVQNTDGTMATHAIIDRGNGEFTSMLKSTYDEQQAALSTPIVSSDAD